MHRHLFQYRAFSYGHDCRELYPGSQRHSSELRVLRMLKYIDWLIPGVIVILVWGAEWDFIIRGKFEPFALAASVSLLLLVRIIQQHLPKFAKRK